MTTFKVYFSEENIRRIRIPHVPTYEEFTNMLQDMYPHYHVELVIKYIDEDGDRISVDSQMEWEEMIDASTNGTYKLYVEDGNGQYFKDGPEPIPIKFYADEFAKEAVHVANDFLGELKKNVPECLASLFKGGKIIPGHLPEFLKDAVEFKYIKENVVDMDVDIPKLFDLLHGKALELLDSVDTSDLQKGRDYLLATLTLVPDHMVALYNLACAESLLGNVEEAIQNLEKAVNAGYRDLTHMMQDADLNNIKNTEAFQFIAAQIASFNEVQPEMEIPEVVEEPVITEPEVIEPETTFDLSASIMPLKETFGDSLQVLKDMGFTADPDVLLLLLEQYNGNIEEVAQFLIGF